MKLCLWIVCALSAVRFINMVGEGLFEYERAARTADASDVLTGCIGIVVVGFAMYGLWTR